MQKRWMGAIFSLMISGMFAHADDETRLIRFQYKPNEISSLCDDAITTAKSEVEKIIQTPRSDQTFANTRVRFERTIERFIDSVLPLTFMGHVFVSTIGKEGMDCQKKMSNFFHETYSRLDLYELFSRHHGTTPAEQRLETREFRSEDYDRLKKMGDKVGEANHLKTKISELGTQFLDNINRDQPVLQFSKADLKGMPDRFFKELNQSKDGKYDVAITLTSFTELMLNIQKSVVRKEILNAFENRAADENIDILKEVLELRKNVASLYGFKNYADYQTEHRMAKDSTTVFKFLSDLGERVAPKNQEELKNLQHIFQEESREELLKAWDLTYSKGQLKKKQFKFNEEDVSPYFPLDFVIERIFDLYGEILGLEISALPNCKLWDERVKIYEIRNKADRKLLSYFYSDLYARPGKTVQSFVAPLRVGRIEDSTLVLPVTAMVENYKPLKKGQPTLISFADVKHLVHMFDYVLHQSLIGVPFATLSGFHIDWNFVAASAQMFENFCFLPEVLKKISGHYQNHKRKLPNSTIQKIVDSRAFLQANSTSVDVALAMTDMIYHTSSDPLDVTQVYKDAFKKWVKVDPLETTHFPASWINIMTVYDAGIYSKLWSRVYAQDMFSRFKKEGPLSPGVGMVFRKEVYERGSLAEPIEIIHDFLGRDPSPDSYYEDFKH